jgi:vitamin B12 transporter
MYILTMRKIVYQLSLTAGLGLFFGFVAQAQDKTLAEISVQGIRPEKFMTGQKIQVLDSATLAKYADRTLAEFIGMNSPIAIKNYGGGQLASVAFRGTAASHTALLWNGININFPSLGMTDFSTVPLSSFDQMSVQYGSASSTVGSDAVGGSILLRSQADFTGNAHKIRVGLRAETSENYNINASYRFHKTLSSGYRISGKTSPYYSLIQHRFGTEPIQRGQKVLNVEPIRTAQSGITQDLYLLSPKHSLWSLNIWLNDHTLSIQPDRPELRENTAATAVRTSLALQHKGTLLRFAYIYDETQYGKGPTPLPSTSSVHRLVLRGEQDLQFGKNQIKIGAEIMHLNGLLDGALRKEEQRGDIYVLARRAWSTRITTSLNLRQAFVTGYNPPFSPAIGGEWILLKSDKNQITWPISIARSYRVPTLNERYWQDLGNPDIKPESGWNKETGLLWQHRFDADRQIAFSATYFHNRIKDWTYWNPAKNYRVENLQEVVSKGWELEAKLSSPLGKIQNDVRLFYAWTHASQQKEYGPYTTEIIGKQLVYVPRHTAGANVFMRLHSWALDLQPQYQSRRYITFDHSGRSFDPFFILNARLAYTKHLKKLYVQCALSMNNLTDTLYPNVKQNAMPMRSFALQLNFGNL